MGLYVQDLGGVGYSAHPDTQAKSLGTYGLELGGSKWITYILYALDDDAMWSWRTGN